MASAEVPAAVASNVSEMAIRQLCQQNHITILLAAHVDKDRVSKLRWADTAVWLLLPDPQGRPKLKVPWTKCRQPLGKDCQLEASTVGATLSGLALLRHCWLQMWELAGEVAMQQKTEYHM